jgi:pimeloyl-ACP methyl ester carboxylesterase
MFNAGYRLAVAALLMLSASASVAQGEYGQTVPPDARAGDLTLAPCQVYLEGDDRDYDADCGTLVVAENRNKPDSRLIALPVWRIKATSADPLQPIFWLEGGPGHANEAIYPSDGLLERHDFVVVGYRGAEGQVVLECPEVGDAIDATTDNLLGEASLAAYGRSAADCGTRLGAEGIDLDGYSMNQVVEDVETVRVALGYDRINLYGNSYGTRLQMIYQWRYPHNVHRVAMVAVNPPGHFIWDPVDTEKLLGRYAALCAEDVYCSGRTTDLIATMKDVARAMPKSWLGISIDPVTVRFITFVSLMESMQDPGEPVPMNGPAVIDLWLDAAEGDASGMALVSLLTPFMLSELFTWGHFLAMGASAPDYLDPKRDYPAELSLANDIIGAPFSLFNWGFIQGWPAISDQSYGVVQDSDIETLLISGELDGSTPPRYARDELLPRLKNGDQVIIKGQGHTETFWNSQAQARARLLNTFFASGEIDDSLYRDQALVFDVDKSWSGMAKMLLALVVGIGAILGFIVVVIVRKVFRASASKMPSSTAILGETS